MIYTKKVNLTIFKIYKKTQFFSEMLPKRSVNHVYNGIFVFFTLFYEQISYKIVNNTKKILKFTLRYHILSSCFVHSRFPPTRSSGIRLFFATSARGNPSIPNLLLCASHDPRSQRCHVNNCMHVLENLPD